jgi:hypothetical protein
MNKTLILNHIKSYLEIKHDKDFALYLGIKQNTLSAWKSREVIDYELIMEKCPFLNGDWLLRNGEGEMLRKKAFFQKNNISGEEIKEEIRNRIQESEGKLLAGMFSINTLIEVLLDGSEINLDKIKKIEKLENNKEYLEYLERFENLKKN